MSPLHSRTQLEARLRSLSGAHVELTITANRSRMLSSRRTSGRRVAVRAHEMFLDAPEHVVRALARWVARKGGAAAEIKQFIRDNSARIASAPPRLRRLVLRTRGRRLDLAELHSRLNHAYFGGRSRAKITWGRRVSRGRVRRARLGTFDPEKELITVSRRLDAADIPRYMVEYVVFHEIAHEMLGVERPEAGRRRNLHDREFEARMRSFPDCERAREFSKKRWGVV